MVSVSLIGLLLALATFGIAGWQGADPRTIYPAMRIKPAITAVLVLAILFLLEPIYKPARRRGQQPVGWFA